jgi:uncharacterized membrane protein
MPAEGTPSDKGVRFSVGGRQASLARVASGRMLASVDTISVWRSGDLGGAEAALRQISSAGIDDAALVWWPAGRRMPSTRLLGAIDRPGALWGGAWGVLLGVVFLAPLAGPALGAAAGAVAGGLAEFGLGDDFILQVREAVTPGTSAIFVVSDRATADRLARELHGLDVRVIRAGVAAQLRYALAEE